MKNPYAISVTRDSDIGKEEWPIITRGVLESILAIEVNHKPEEINQELMWLARARKAINDAICCTHRAIRIQSKEKVRDRLEELVKKLDDAYDVFPLTVKGKPAIKRTA